MKKPISATIDTELIVWIGKMLKDPSFRNKSHLIEIALERMKEDMEKNGRKKL